MKTINGVVIFLFFTFLANMPGFANIDSDFLNLEYVPNSQLGSNVGGKYIDKNNSQKYYAKFYTNINQAKSEFFANKIYSLFGLSAPESFLVKLNHPSLSKISLALVTKWEDNLEALHAKNYVKSEKYKEQIAKIHLITSLVENWDVAGGGNIYFQGDNLFVMDFGGSFKFRAMGGVKKYGPKADAFVTLLNPFINLTTAFLFQQPFEEYTKNHASDLIIWLKKSFDEIKINKLFEESGLEDKEILENLKYRSQDLVNKLAEVEKNPDFIMNEIERNLRKIYESYDYLPKDPFVAKNIEYEFVDELPLVGRQILFCYDDSEVWLEFTNYEFLMNSKDSDRLVKVVLGKNNNVLSSHKINKKPLEFFDPESVYVFQDSVLRYCDKLLEESCGSLNLADIINVGYDALNYHFNMIGVKSDDYFYDSSSENLLLLIDKRHLSYIESQKKHGREITQDYIGKMQDLGFLAFYPKPIHMGTISWKLRPSNMEYNDYKNKLMVQEAMREGGPAICEEEFLYKNNTPIFSKRDKHTHIFEELDKNSLDHLDHINLSEHKFMETLLGIDVSDNYIPDYKFSDLRRLSIYSFRGTNRTPEQIKSAGGFLPKTKTGVEPYSFDRAKLTLEKYDNWNPKDHVHALWLTSNSLKKRTMYVASSALSIVANEFVPYNYPLYTDGVLELSTVCHMHRFCSEAGEREILMPSGISWENVIGFRKSTVPSNKGFAFNISYGPVFLKKDFSKIDEDNFWKILNIFGGKSQCKDALKNNLEKAKKCLDFFSLVSSENKNKEELCLRFSALYKNDNNQSFMNREKNSEKCELYAAQASSNQTSSVATENILESFAWQNNCEVFSFVYDYPNI